MSDNCPVLQVKGKSSRKPFHIGYHLLLSLLWSLGMRKTSLNKLTSCTALYKTFTFFVLSNRTTDTFMFYSFNLDRFKIFSVKIDKTDECMLY